MIYRHITNIVLKKEVLDYLRKYRSYLVRKERAHREYDKEIKRKLLLEYDLHYGVKVRVKYKGRLIEGKMVGFPKENRDTFCFESSQLDVIEKEYTHALTKKTITAKRKYFPYDSIDLPKTAIEEFKTKSKGFKFDSFEYDFKYASEEFIQSLKKTIITKQDVDDAISFLSPMKVSREIRSPEERFENCQRAIQDGMGWLHPITFLYNEKPEIGFVGHYPSLSSDYIKVYSGFIDTGGYCKYVKKSNFIRFFKDYPLGMRLAGYLRAKIKKYCPQEEPFDYLLPPRFRLGGPLKAAYSIYDSWIDKV